MLDPSRRTLFVRRKRRAVPASPEDEESSSPKAAASAVAVGLPVGSPTTNDSMLRQEVERNSAAIQRIWSVLRSSGLKESSGSEDEAGKPVRAVERFKTQLRRDELVKTAAVMGLQAPPPSDSLPKARKRFKTTLQTEIQRRREAEFKQREDAAAAAYHEVKYDEVHAANAELHAKIEAMAVPTTTVHTNAAPQATSHDHVKRKIKKLIHPDRIPTHLRNSPRVQEYSTSLAQGLDSCF